MSTLVDVRRLADLAVLHGAEQKPAELAALGEVIQQRELKTAIELGSGRGATAWFLASIGMTVCSVDLRLPIIHRARNDVPGTTFVHSSTWAYAQKAQPADLVIIDAGHSFDDVLLDYELYREKVRPGGVMAFHDVVRHAPEHDPRGECEVWRLWEEIRDVGGVQTQELIGPPLGWGGFGLILL